MARSDQYSLACVVYEMLSGAPPFVANTPQGVIAKRFSERPAPLPSSRKRAGRGIRCSAARACSRPR